MSEPTYLIWTPRFVETTFATSAIRFNVTPLSAVDWPVGEGSFYGQLMGDVGVQQRILSWDVLPYRSRYHSDPSATDWRDRWKRNWRVTVHCDRLPGAPPLFEEGYESFAFDAKPAVPDGETMHAFILVDFPDSRLAGEARAALKHVVAGDPHFELVELKESFCQLQIQLGKVPDTFFVGAAAEANRIEQACRELGGWPTFDERIRVLG